MATPQIRIISLPDAGTLTAPVTLEYLAIESAAAGGRKIPVDTFLSQAGALLYAINPASRTDRAIATYDSTLKKLRDNPNATIDASGNIYAPGLYATSSERYKCNIVSIIGAVDLVKQLDGVWFNWIEVPEDGRNLGVIAEEVNKVLPEVVRKDQNGNCEGVDYSKIVPLLINAIKELSAQVEELKAQNNVLK